MITNKPRIIFVISVFSLLIALLWIYMSIFKIIRKDNNKQPSKIKIDNINPTIDENILNELEKRVP